jgi:25S rRNA (uracil2634-N3)-methyltransferase
MKRKGCSGEAADESRAKSQRPRDPKPPRLERSTEGLHVQRSTLRCAHGGCVPCCYKVVLHTPPGWPRLRPNQRPEMCPRAELQAAPIVPGERRHCGLYDDRMDILTVGDGDFSFSLALARALYPDAACSDGSHAQGFGRLVATSHESEASVLRVYPNAADTLAELRARGVAVYHDVDATDLQTTLPPCAGKDPARFHRVVWNFPCIGRGLEAGHDGQNTEMEANKQLVRDFCCSAAPLLWPAHIDQRDGGGEVHITHKTKPPYNHWGLVPLAANAQSGLVWRGSVIFDRCSYPPYINRKALGAP